MIAVVAPHGTHDQVQYVTCAIQTKRMNRGGRLIAAKVYIVADYADPEVMSEVMMAWVMTHKPKTVHMAEGLSQPRYCHQDGVPTMSITTLD